MHGLCMTFKKCIIEKKYHVIINQICFSHGYNLRTYKVTEEIWMILVDTRHIILFRNLCYMQLI